MARTTTKSVDEAATIVEPMVADVSATENKNVKKNFTTNTNVKNVSTKPLNDSDEINVVSLIPNVSYKDSKTGDMYQWDEVGHIEIMTFETLKNMWRNHKGYFRNMWLKPNDDRVINKFGITKVFEKYEYLMDEDNYNKENIKELCSVISNTPNELKYSVVNKIKDLIVSEKLTDVVVIRNLEKHLNLDLISSLN